MQIDNVRMIGPDGTVSKISESEACAMRNNVFMRGGNVSIEGTDTGYIIKDQHGITTLTAVFKEELTDDKA